MAEKKTDAEKGKGKGVAFGKWAKIDKAQRNMLVAVCVASIALGVTAVCAIYFVKVIAFNGKLIDEKSKVIADYKSIQSNLDSLSSAVEELKTNESLEAVARTRSYDCSMLMENPTSQDVVSEVEIAKVCSALRVIPDALPSLLNKEATLASLNQLLLLSNPSINIEALSGTDVDYVPSFNGEDEEDEEEYVEEEDEDGESGSLQVIGASLVINDTVANVYNALDTIENSIRNYDLLSATIGYSGDSRNSDTIELSATYGAYYSNSVDITKKSKKVCADNNSTKCTGSSK